MFQKSHFGDFWAITIKLTKNGKIGHFFLKIGHFSPQKCPFPLTKIFSPPGDPASSPLKDRLDPPPPLEGGTLPIYE